MSASDAPAAAFAAFRDPGLVRELIARIGRILHLDKRARRLDARVAAPRNRHVLPRSPQRSVGARASPNAGAKRSYSFETLQRSYVPTCGQMSPLTDGSYPMSFWACEITMTGTWSATISSHR